MPVSGSNGVDSPLESGPAGVPIELGVLGGKAEVGGALAETGAGTGSTTGGFDSSEGQVPPRPGISSISIPSGSAFAGGDGDSEGL